MLQKSQKSTQIIFRTIEILGENFFEVETSYGREFQFWKKQNSENLQKMPKNDQIFNLKNPIVGRYGRLVGR